MSGLVLSAGSEADAPAIAALATYVFLDTYATEGLREDLAREVFGGYSVSTFLERLRDPATAFVLAYVGGHLVGFAEIASGRKCPVPGTDARAELVRLYVHRRFHGRAIGAALLSHAEQRGPVWLAAWSGNANALAFYAARGYQRLGTIPYVVEDRTYENIVFARKTP